MKKKPWRTVEEHLAEMAKDPDYVARKQREEEELQRRQAEYAQAQAPLLRDLKASAGLQVRSVWDLVNSTASYPDALPILLNHLQRPYPPVIREGIARALAVRDAAFAWPVLVSLYRRETEERVRDGLAIAVANTADRDALDTLISLIRDERLGASRIFLVDALPRFDPQRAHIVATEFVGDPELGKEAEIVLHRLKKRGQ